MEISENPSEILGKSPFLTKYGSIWFFHNNLFNIEYLSLQVMFILINIELPTKWYRTPLCMLHILILICHFITCFTKIVHIAKQQQWQQSYFSIANFSKNVNVNTCQYPDVSIGDRSDFNFNFSSELWKIVRHLKSTFSTAGSVWTT